MVDFLFGTDFICMFLLIFVFGGLSHLGIILPGVLTDSKWTLLGSIRACILYISYDIVILICWLLLLPDGLSVNLFTSGTLSVIVDSQHSLITLNVFRYPFLFILFFLTILIEIGRIPSDLAEAESELVSGYNVEYGGFLYAMMASSEYAAMVLGGLLLILLFFGISSYYLLSLGLVLIFSLFILIRGTLPRVRYTDLLKLYWCDLMPLLLVVLSVYIII
jgi:NADH-quinone oxidoreductase subunit H